LNHLTRALEEQQQAIAALEAEVKKLRGSRDA